MSEQEDIPKQSVKDSKALKSGEMKQHVFSDYTDGVWLKGEGGQETIDAGTAFFEGDIIAIGKGDICGNAVFAEVSGYFHSIEYTSEDPYEREVALNYYTFTSGDRPTSTFSGVRVLYAPCEGTVKYLENHHIGREAVHIDGEGFAEVCNMHIGRLNVSFQDHERDFFVLEFLVEGGGYANKGEPVCLYLSSRPSKKQVDNFLAKRSASGAAEEMQRLNTEKDLATKLIFESEVKAKEIIKAAKAEGGLIIKQAKEQGAQARTLLLDATEVEAESKREAILESARNQRKEALEVNKAAKIEVSARLQQIEDDAEKLTLVAITERLYTLMDRGEKAAILELPQLRTLYLKLGELLADSQGVSAPETAERVATFNKIDDMEAVYAYVSKKIKNLDPDGTWPDDVRKAAIRDFSDIAKGQSADLMR